MNQCCVLWDLYLIYFEFIQVGQERVHGSLPHHLHGRTQSFKGSVSDLRSRVVHLLQQRKRTTSTRGDLREDSS